MKLWFLTTFFFWIFLCIDWSHSYDRSAIRPKWLTFTNPWRNVLTESTFLWKRLLPRMVTNHVTYKPLIQILHEAFEKICTKCCIQGRNKVFFFLNWSCILPQILIPDHKNVENFNPWSQKHWEFWSLIPKTFTILIPDSTKTLLIPIPSVVIPDPGAVIPDLIYLVTTL